MSIADQFIIGNYDPSSGDYDDLAKALRFSNPLDTRLPNALSFTNPVKYGTGSKPGVFGKLTDAYLSSRISLSEFGSLIGKFSETCTEDEWVKFYKPVLEQRLVYDWGSTSFTSRFPMLTGPTRVSVSYTRATLPKRYYVGVEGSGAYPLDIRVGGGKMEVYRNSCLTNATLLEFPSDLLLESDTIYGFRTTDWAPSLTFGMVDVKTIDDMYVWDDHWEGRSLRRTYHERRMLMMNLLQDDHLVPDYHRGTPEDFDKVSRILFEQGMSATRGLIIHDADSTRNLLGDVWKFENIKNVPVLEVHGDDHRGLDYLVVDFKGNKFPVHQGDRVLTLNTRRKIYNERDVWIGKQVVVHFDEYTEQGIPNYAYWSINGKDQT